MVLIPTDFTVFHEYLLKFTGRLRVEEERQEWQNGWKRGLKGSDLQLQDKSGEVMFSRVSS